jgi:hypothetical protein
MYSPQFSALQARSSLKLPARQFLNGRPPLYFVKRGNHIIFTALHPLFAKPTLYTHLVIVEIIKLLIHIKLEIKKYFLYMFHILIFRSGVLAEKDD